MTFKFRWIVLILVLWALAAIAISQGNAQVVFDYNPPALGSSEVTERNDLNAELDGINADKTDFVDIDTSGELRAIISGEVGTGAIMFGLHADMANDLGCTANEFVVRNGTNTAFDCVAGGGGGLVAADIDTSAEIAAIMTDEVGSADVLVFLGTPADDQVPVGDGATNTTWRTLPDSDGATQKLQYDQATNAFSAGTDDDIPDAGDYTNLSATAPITQSGGTISTSMTTSRLIGRTTAATGVMEEIAVNSTLSLSSLTLGVVDVTCTDCLGSTEVGALDSGDVTTGSFTDGRVNGANEADEVNPTLGTQTQGNYVDDVIAGVAIDVTHTPGEGSDATVDVDLTELSSVTLGAGAFTGITFDAGTNDPGLFTSDQNFIFDSTGGVPIIVSLDDEGLLRFREEDAGGDNYIEFKAPAAIGTNRQCVLVDGAAPIPDSCVGDGTDAGAGGGIANVVEDTTPQLGGDLDTNGFAIEFGTANTDTSVVRSSAGNISIEGNVVYRAGGTDVAVADGGTGASSLNDLITLTTHTAGNYAAGDAEAGAALTGDSATSFFSTGSIEDARLTLKTESMCFALSDETTTITTGTAKITWHMPYAFTLTGVSSSVNTVSTSGLPTIDINEDPDAEGGTAAATILSTKLTIDANERRSSTAATAAVISDSALAANAEMIADIDVAGTGAKGLKLCLIGHQ